MFNLDALDQQHLDLFVPIVDDLVKTVGLDPDKVLVVGAVCRDILHASQGHKFPLRATHDLDLGIAVSDWTLFRAIKERYPRLGSTGIRFLVHDLPVDVVPFGAVEEPTGLTRIEGRDDDLVVFGFREVYEHSARLPLPSGSTVRLPTPAGYAALKMRAWIDRSKYGHNADARDLALAVWWYCESDVIRDRLYDTDEGFAHLVLVDMDADLAATRLLAHDIAAILGASQVNDLAWRWAKLDQQHLARDFTLAAGGPPSSSFARRLEVLAQLTPRGGPGIPQ